MIEVKYAKCDRMFANSFMSSNTCAMGYSSIEEIRGKVVNADYEPPGQGLSRCAFSRT